MITFLVKLSLVLKPFHKFTYLLAIVLIANIVYQLVFSVMPSATDSNEIMLNFLALAWLALVNFMIQVFSRIPVASQSKSTILVRIKNRFHQGFYYLLSLVFIVISIAVILLSFKMLRL
ncbi:hypothetical protein [Candidatus Colwellia aromaticivorans]|uniref:hypothetical protein n=1 Tax=Candidatus Colwellia aromaticivorans TaxID=2267621 RepID=UPI00109B77C8|nr:hypothetical protein [Candidatus Colwellia aromaticivorans]